VRFVPVIICTSGLLFFDNLIYAEENTFTMQVFGD